MSEGSQEKESMEHKLHGSQREMRRNNVKEIEVQEFTLVGLLCIG